MPITAEGAGALLFYGYFDQTDIFFKMAKALSLNTTALDQAVVLKRTNDVPYFTPATQLRNGETPKGIIMLPNAPLTTPRLLNPDEDQDDH